MYRMRRLAALALSLCLALGAISPALATEVDAAPEQVVPAIDALEEPEEETKSQEPTEEVQEPEEAQEPTEGVQEPEEAQEPAGEAQEPAGEAQEPEEAQEPAGEAQEPEEAQEPTEWAQEPEESEEPAEAPEAEEPAEESRQAPDEPGDVLQIQEGEDEEGEYDPSQDDPAYFSPEVTLMEGEDHGDENYYALRSALSRADGVHPLNIRVAAPGRYHVNSGGGALMLRDLTTLDLNGAVLIRAGGMKNLMQNESLDGERSVEGYTATHDVTVKNGTLDGGGNSMPKLNMVNLGHAQGLHFENVTFLHGQGSHLLELNGCRDCTITGCTFDGYDFAGTKNRLEAIQLDISCNDTGDNWNGVYCESGSPGCDNTVCENILVENCDFKDYPSGVGNHHCLYGGPRSRNIVIRGNRFTNSVDWGKVNDFEPPAVWCYGLEDSEVSGNTITGVYRCGVRFSGGSVKVKGNAIGTGDRPVSYPPIYVTEANCYVLGKYKKRKPESVTGGCVDENTIYTSYAKGNNAAVTVYGKSKLSSVSGNRIWSTRRNGIVIGSGSTVTNVKSNQVTNPGKCGIYITQSTVKNVNGNTVQNAKKNGIEVTSSGKVTNVKSNTVSGCKGTGIRIVNKKLTVKVQKNKLKGNKKALYVTAKGKIQKK